MFVLHALHRQEFLNIENIYLAISAVIPSSSTFGITPFATEISHGT